ncbi:MAG: GDSL-type esterase/lipase family protein [Opitutus sp.]
MIRLLSLGLAVLLVGVAQAAEMPSGVRKVKDIVIYQDAKFHSAFPSVIRRPDGEIVLAFRRAPNRRALGEEKNYHVDPNSYLVQTRSRDGVTWTPPELLYAHPFGGSQDPCLLQLRDGPILCMTYGWTFVRPDGVPKLKPPFLENFPGSIFNGGYFVRSENGGKSWAGPFYPPHIAPEVLRDAYGEFVPAYNRGALIEGRDGRIFWVCAASDQELPRKTSTYLLISEDRGVTWKYSCPVASDPKVEFNETSIYETPKGDLVAFLRSEKFEDQTCIARSTDGGKSFQPWKGMGFQGHPLHALRLPDQRVLLTYGYRHAPLGIRARILNAECTDAATAPEIVLRDDGGTTDLGYPWSVMLDDRHVLVAYYFNVGKGIQHIAGTILEIDAAPSSPPTAATDARTSPGSVLRSKLTSSVDHGVRYLQDDLTTHSADPAPLLIRTGLADPANCGRRVHGWSVKGGIPDAYTRVVLRDRPMLGNRSQIAQLSFASTQTGVAEGAHGLVEMTLCRGTTPEDLPLRIRVEDGRFYILGLNGDTLLAGNRDVPALTMSRDTVYTLNVLLFQKAIFARLSGADVPDGAIELTIPDRRRFVPGRPGFGLRPNSTATGGELRVFDWSVTPVAPATPPRLAVIGDSITAGPDGEPEAESYAAIVSTGVGQELVFNTGSGGSTTALDLDRFPFEVAPFRPEIVWIEGGTNDIGTGVSAEVAFRNMQQEADLVTWGGVVVYSTVPPRTLPTAAHYAELTHLNELIRASGRPVVDRYAIVVDPTDPKQIRPEFRHTDGIHITKPGQTRIAEEATRLLRTLTTRPIGASASLSVRLEAGSACSASRQLAVASESRPEALI